MTAEQEVLESLRRALAPELPSDELGRLRVEPGPPRRRSALYFAGLGDVPRPYRWVVKQPYVDRRQEDLTSPLAAAEQFEALERLHAHLLAHGDGIAAPRPVAMLPELGGYVMEFVPGASVRDLVTARALLDPEPLLLGIDAAARVLHAVHSLEPAQPEVVDVTDLRAATARHAPGLLSGTGVAADGLFSYDTPPAPETDVDGCVVLHGDFAPENTLVADSGVYCIDADLASKGPAAVDVARFVTMLFEVPLFLRGADVPQIQELRRRAAVRFLDGYYRGGRGPSSLQPMVLLLLASRCRTRHADLADRGLRLAALRRSVLRRHFGKVLREVAEPGWPHR